MQRLVQTLMICLAILSCFQARADIIIHNPTVRLMPPGLPNTAAYMTITNTGDNAVVLVGAESTVALKASFHQSVLHGEQTVMKQIEQLIIPPKDSKVLAPGGAHIMLMQLVTSLKVGQTVPLTLLAENGERFDLAARVEGFNATHSTHHH